MINNAFDGRQTDAYLPHSADPYGDKWDNFVLITGEQVGCENMTRVSRGLPRRGIRSFEDVIPSLVRVRTKGPHPNLFTAETVLARERPRDLARRCVEWNFIGTSPTLGLGFHARKALGGSTIINMQPTGEPERHSALGDYQPWALCRGYSKLAESGPCV